MPSLQRAILGCHALLAIALVTGVLQPVTAARVVVAVSLALPLILAAHGLVLGRRATLQRLAVLLVAYIGGLSVEVVASLGSAYTLAVALLAAALELGLLLAFIRQTAPRQPRARE